MPATFELRELYDAMEEDQWRKANPFSTELALVQQILTHPYARDSDKIDAMESWLQRHQPCVFGRMAAITHGMHFCILTDEDIFTSDQHVKSRIHAELLAWKRRSLRPAAGMPLPAHGFMLIVASLKLALARPDASLHRFASKLRELWGCTSTDSPHGRVFWESLFLANPNNDSFAKFTFSIDFFAAQGDGRWWHDHRVPSGIAFTANSVGHMRRYREWYDGKGDQKEWLLSTAMRTIEMAAKTPYGQATWLRPLQDGHPFVKRVICPFGNPDKLSSKLRGMDWTRYGGHLHTDHSIRSEFFKPEPEKSRDIESQQWLQDFVYLYDPANGDYEKFSAGRLVREDEVIQTIGDPEEFTQLAGPIAADNSSEVPQNLDVQKLLNQCQQWRLTQEELEAFQFC